MENITFNLTRAEAEKVVQSLGEQPYKNTFQLIAKLQAQYQKQTASAVAPNQKDAGEKAEEIVKKSSENHKS